MKHDLLVIQQCFWVFITCFSFLWICKVHWSSHGGSNRSQTSFLTFNVMRSIPPPPQHYLCGNTLYSYIPPHIKPLRALTIISLGSIIPYFTGSLLIMQFSETSTTYTVGMADSASARNLYLGWFPLTCCSSDTNAGGRWHTQIFFCILIKNNV